MSNVGEQIAALFTQVERLYRQTANLLETADSLLETHGWKPTNGTAITGSNSLWQPDGWFASYAHRFYQNEQPACAHLLPYISVLLYGSDLPRPLVTAGVMDYGVGEAVNNNFYYSYARLHLLMAEGTDDGVFRVDDSTKWSSQKYPFESVGTLAVPLEEVPSSDELKRRIVSPLLEASTCASG